MLAIRMQRTGRKGHAMFRVVVQDSRRTPTSGKVVARLGSYDPHAKTVTLDKDKASFYLEHGAQPSERAAILLQKEGVKLPKWVKLSSGKKRDVRNPDKRRSTRPQEEMAEEAPAVEESAEPTEEKPTEEPSSGSDAEESKDGESTEAEAAETTTAESADESTAEASDEKPADDKVAANEDDEPASEDKEEADDKKAAS